MIRREFLKASAVLAGAALTSDGAWAAMKDTRQDFKQFQEVRRKELWGLLGDLPERREPVATAQKREQHAGYTLEHLELELNGIQPVPALMLIPDNIKTPAPGMIYIHWHGGDYNVGKMELLQGTRAMKAYAPVYAEKGIVALAIDSWCFGERAPYPEEGRRGEEDTFKEMLWKGQVLFGMMLFDEWQALNYLCSRPEIDTDRIGAFGISMGSTKAWWLAALDERIKLCIDLCCLTDFESLIADKGLHRHGIYYYVPNLLKRFDTAGINELIVPRPRLSLNGRQDSLTPPLGVEKVRDYLLPLYEQYGRKEDCRIELFDCPHQELPEMRAIVLQWLDQYLAT
jgi:cephalosporin-C deacetylase-like acetyl esterase